MSCSHKLATLKSFKADISSVSPFSEEMEELWVVCVDMQKMELHHWWEHGDKKKMINQLNGKHSLVLI